MLLEHSRSGWAIGLTDAVVILGCYACSVVDDFYRFEAIILKTDVCVMLRLSSSY